MASVSQTGTLSLMWSRPYTQSLWSKLWGIPKTWDSKLNRLKIIRKSLRFVTNTERLSWNTVGRLVSKICSSNLSNTEKAKGRALAHLKIKIGQKVPRVKKEKRKWAKTLAEFKAEDQNMDWKSNWWTRCNFFSLVSVAKFEYINNIV